MVFTTRRLLVRLPAPSDEDVGLFRTLWDDPRVMSDVGFPEGLGISAEKVRERITLEDDSEFDRPLVAELRETGEPVGECLLGSPGEDGVCETDVKLLPRFWRRGLGSELKRGLVDHLFTRTACTGVRATPNRRNIASQRMQEGVGARRVGEGVSRPEKPSANRAELPYYEYLVTREDWEKLPKPS